MLASCRAVMAAVRPGIVATHYFNGKLEPLLTQQHQRITPCIYLASTASNFNCDGNNESVTSWGLCDTETSGLEAGGEVAEQSKAISR